ncbi:hypothetical protein ACP70R_012726 [Stipagrostis hirtigluma subsp. patula]
MASLSHHSAGSGSGFPRRTSSERSSTPTSSVSTPSTTRHFMSSCSLLLGVSSHARRGHICIDYHGRNVLVSILAVGVDMGQLRAELATPGAAAKAKEIAEAYRGQTVDADLFKGVDPKLLALVKLFDTEPGMRGKVVLVQINNPGATAAATSTASAARRRRSGGASTRASPRQAMSWWSWSMVWCPCMRRWLTTHAEDKQARHSRNYNYLSLARRRRLGALIQQGSAARMQRPASHEVHQPRVWDELPQRRGDIS